MKRERKSIPVSLMAMLMVLVMLVSLIQTLTANAATTSKKASYKKVKTVNYTLAGKEIRTLTFSAGIVKISFGSQSAVRMKKVTDKKVRITGVKNGKTRFVVVTKDGKKIVCNISRSHTLNTKYRSKNIVKTSVKVKSVKSSNTKIAKVTKDGKSYTVSTTGKHGKARITVKYVNNVTENIIVGNHSWKRKKIKDAYDEKVYMGDHMIHNITGEDMSNVYYLDWCKEHDCPIHFLGDGMCACDTHSEPIYKTVHHDAQYKIYCSKCGATK